jgi:HEAT repeat protein
LLLCSCLVAAASLNAQAPAIQNADLEARSASVGLKATIETLAGQSTDAVWIAYSVPMIPGDRTMCCFSGDGDSGCCKGCHLEESRGDSQGTRHSQAVQLEPSRSLLVLARAEAGRLDKLRTYSSDCPLDAGGRRVYWLNDVEARQSVDYLAELVRGSDWPEKQEKKIANGALAAIAHHDGPAPAAAMAGFLAPERPRELRKQAAFWLGNTGGAAGLQTLRKAVRSDNDERFREDAMFAFNVSRETESVDELIHFARNDSSARVRKQALFWLAQKAGKKAMATLTVAVEQDPDTEVKKQAVFALSQLPKDEGVVLLIQVARTNNNRTVRKQAMFWLGQSNDPRALAFFEEVLAR